jgi:hypothetical protein
LFLQPNFLGRASVESFRQVKGTSGSDLKAFTKLV